MKNLFSISLMLSLFVIVAVSGALSMYFVGEVTADFIVCGLGVAFLFAMTPKVALFSTIPVDQVRAAITNSMVAIYTERVEVKSFLRSFFPSVTSDTKYISMEIQRANAKLAVDILRGTGSNPNQKTRSTVKTLLPPYFDEKYNVNELEVYDVAYNSMDVTTMRQLASEQAQMVRDITDKIDRSYEKQCADVFNTGIITLKSEDNIDFRRRADSLDDTAGEYWSTTTNDPDVTFIKAAQFLTEYGRINMGAGTRIPVILGTKAFQDLINNPIFQKKHDLKSIDLGAILPASMSTSGAAYHGYISVGSYIFDLWTYPQFYELANGTKTYYINARDVIFTSYNAEFKFVYGAVPQLKGLVSPLTIKEGFYTMEWLDPANMNHVQKIMSAGVALPVAIDKIFTARATGA